MEHLHTATSSGQPLVLRPHAEHDAARILAVRQDPETLHWLGRPGYTLADAEDYVRALRAEVTAGTGLAWAVTDTDDRYLASVHLMGHGAPVTDGAEVGLQSHPGARGRGVVSAGLRRAVDHAFGPAGLRRLYYRCSAGNHASARVAVRAGFVATGRDRRCNRLPDGSWDDQLRFDLLPEEWPAAPGPLR